MRNNGLPYWFLLLIPIVISCRSPVGRDMPATTGEDNGKQAGSDADGPAKNGEEVAVRKSPPGGEPVSRELTLGGVKPAANDTLLLSYSQGPDTINPITSSDNVSNAFQMQVYESLATTDFTDPTKLLPSLAESWEFDEENLEYTVRLRKGVKWHPMKLPNGKPLPEREFTARDVKFSFDCVLNPHIEAAHIRSYFENPNATDPEDRYKVKVRIVDDHTVKIKWTEPYFMADEFTLAGFAMIPRHVFSVDENGEPISFDFSSKEFADGFNNHWANNRMCGTGPMRFIEWSRNERLVLRRFEDYWGEPYFFSQLYYTCIPNPNTPVELVLQNDLDFVAVPEKDKFEQMKQEPNVKNGKVVLDAHDYPGYRYIGYNMRRDLFKDKEFRRALAYAVPVQQIIDKVFQGLAIPVAGPFLPGSSQADPSIEPIPFDLEEAKRILDEAGWKDTNGNGIRDKVINNETIEAQFDLLIFSNAPSFQTVASIIKENFRKIGVDVQLTPAEWQLMLQKLRKWDFDAAMLGWGTSWNKSDPFQLWHGSQADVQDSSNHCGYQNDRVDKLIEELRVTMDPQKQKELSREIFRLIHEDQPYTFLFSEQRTAAYDGRLKNVKFYRVRPCYDSREWHSDRPRVLGR